MGGGGVQREVSGRGRGTDILRDKPTYRNRCAVFKLSQIFVYLRKEIFVVENKDPRSPILDIDPIF